MSRDKRDQRQKQGTSLIVELSALDKMPDEHRTGYLLERIDSTVADICKAHAKQNRPAFTPEQIDALTDIACQLMLTLDPKSRTSKGFIGKTWDDFKAQGPLKQIGIVVGVIVALAPGILMGVSSYRVYQAKGFWGAVDHFMPPAPAASTPSTAATQGAPAPRTQP